LTESQTIYPQVPLRCEDRKQILPKMGYRGQVHPTVRGCAGFRLPAVTTGSTRSGGRRPKSAKARNRGQWCSGGAAGAMGILSPGDAVGGVGGGRVGSSLLS